ncbi:unnamed protein product [Dracunculus medinensis]|uniref:Uncharacterized protein n=1 Tax=Dracunculus medinensis TaxID=318479 RepID=A0A0N4U9A5_DRAME|nr:unnamed protein product [Dracunculus medinensis]
MPTIWLKYIQTITATKKREGEEKAYEYVTEGEHGLFRIIHERKEALITLMRYKDDAEQKLEHSCNPTVKNCQNLSTFTDTKLNKLGQRPRYSLGETALSMLRSNPKLSSDALRSNQHSSQLTISIRKPSIFYTEDHWDSECNVYPTVNSRRNRIKLLKNCPVCFKDSHNYSNNTTKETLLLCKEVKVFNPTQLQRQKKALALFDIEVVASIEVIRIRQTNYGNNSIWNEESNSLPHGFYATEGANNGKRCYSVCNVQELSSGYILVQSKVGLMIAGSGDVSKLCQNDISLQNLVCTAKDNINSELEKFWRLESIGIQESSNDNDDEETLKCFQRTKIHEKGWSLSCVLALEGF